MKTLTVQMLSLLFLASSVLAHAACATTEPGDRCDDSHGTRDIGGCASETSHWVCAGGEGSFYWTERACGIDAQCVGDDTSGACIGPGEGEACTPDTGCRPDLVCVSNVCKHE